MSNAILVEPYAFSSVTAEGSTSPTVPFNLDNDWIGVVHRGTATTTGGAVSGDLGSARSVDTLALLSALNTPASYQVLGGTTSGSGDVYNSGTVTPFAAGATDPVSGRQNSLHLLSSPATARYWYVGMGTLPGATFEAGRYVVGRRVQLGRNFAFGASLGLRDLGGGDFNDRGVWLPRPGKVLRTIGLRWPFAARDEAEATVLPLMERIGNGKFILLVTDPDASTYRQRRMYFGPLQGNLEMIWNVGGYHEWRANILSVI